jgi:DNA repair protein SbcC/Rad50
MIISKVELENIKNYEEGTFEFEPGVTAISGPNGAGKTTLIEAISWAIFDQLPYKKEDFLRRGAKKGAVRVTFVSAIDAREYTVYRDTATGYYIYDPITKMRLVEQKQQVGAWIKQHLGVEPGTDLKALFVSTIGVPQGMFTVDFAEQPAKRKISFDKTLRVDEYQRSSEDLRSIVRLVESREIELREEIARVEVEASQLDFMYAEKIRLKELIEQAKIELAETERARDAAREELEKLDELRNSIERMAADRAALASRSEEAKRRYEALGAETVKSREASNAVAASTAGYEAYNDANLKLSGLEPKAAARDALKKELSDQERERYGNEILLQAQREKSSQLERDRKELERLAPLAQEQERIEKRREELQRELGELGALQKREEASKRELESLRANYSDVSKKIEEAEKLRETAARAPELEQERRRLEDEKREMQIQLARIAERRLELKRAADNIAKLRGELQTLETEIASRAMAEELAAGLPTLESEYKTIYEEATSLRVSIEREEKIISRIQDGLCPLLAQRCLNMKDGQGLDQFFTEQVSDEREQLKKAERAKKEIERKLDKAKAASRASSGLASQRVYQTRLTQDLEIEIKNAARLEQDVSAQTINDEAVKSVERKLAKVEESLEIAQAAKAEVEKLGLLRDLIEQLKKEGSEKRKESEELSMRLGAMAGLKLEFDQIQTKLDELDDPRTRSRILREGLSKETEIRESLLELERREQAASVSIKALLERLEEFVHLDQQISSERERRAAFERDYRAFIENKPIADLLVERELNLARVELEVKTLQERIQALELDLAAAQAAYDEDRRLAAKQRLEDLINRAAALNSALSVSTSRLEEINLEIKRLTVLNKRLEKLIRNKERCQQLSSVSEFIRDLLRKAGPFITEAHLQSISIEANELYREITGNPMVSLRWDVGYEIILEEGGHERSFASLSGGEQMAAALAVRLALLKELSDLRIAFFDEPTTNMDEERRRNLAQQIGRIKDFDQLFVISHDDAFEGFTDRVVSVRGQAEGA